MSKVIKKSELKKKNTEINKHKKTPPNYEARNIYLKANLLLIVTAVFSPLPLTPNVGKTVCGSFPYCRYKRASVEF